MDYTLTNLFSSELADRGYRFLARNTDDSLYAFKNEPTKVNYSDLQKSELRRTLVKILF